MSSQVTFKSSHKSFNPSTNQVKSSLAQKEEIKCTFPKQPRVPEVKDKKSQPQDEYLKARFLYFENSKYELHN